MIQKAADLGTPNRVTLIGRAYYQDFQRLTGQQRSLVETLSMPGLSAIEFDVPRTEINVRHVDLS